MAIALAVILLLAACSSSDTQGPASASASPIRASGGSSISLNQPVDDDGLRITVLQAGWV